MQASCQCGSLTAAVADDAEPMTIICHCVEGQKRSGSPFGAIAYYPEASVTVSGQAREYARPTDSGSTFTTGFCPTCGSTVYAKAAQYPGITGVTLGTLADPHFPPPIRSVYEQSRFDWITAPEGTARHPRGRDS